MSIIGSLNPYTMATSLQRTRAEELDFKKSSDAALLIEPGKPRENERVAPAFKSAESNAHQQAYDEAFARMLVTLNSSSAQASEDTTQSLDDIVASNESKGAPKQSAVDEFMAYMNMTPAEKMRDKILKEVGMTEEELENMPPEQRAAAEREIAEKMQTLQELKAAQDEQGTLHEHA
ncbi:hypothetical protein [Phytopseudomonas punonensis]|uniref:Uncharacterized protein n=1 Tax=Phytopseudomonas punonensis TaxID=1220495 RepID=A0A1M7GFH9_9GAMM|nr:hypothetical protein [Pseudomonas punonensis]SHM15053.1 hypothetical protein SAMN05216288_3172 [Pseudomonas punonensis]